jgi:hypothetical protein
MKYSVNGDDVMKIKNFILPVLFLACSTAFAQSAPQPTTSSLSQLMAKSPCQPMAGKLCEVTTDKFVDTMDFLRRCSTLKGWALHFQYGPTLMLTFTGDDQGCAMTATSTHFADKPYTVTCKFSREQTQQMLSQFPDSSALSQQFARGGTVNPDTLAKIKPVVDCMEPLTKMDRRIEMNNLKNIKIPLPAPANAPASAPQ